MYESESESESERREWSLLYKLIMAVRLQSWWMKTFTLYSKVRSAQ